MKVILFLGAPGSGKGTQSGYLLRKHSIPILGMGDLLRKEIKKNNEISDVLVKHMNQGKIAPWSVTKKVFTKALDSLSGESLVILDGIPRNLEQALDVGRTLQERNISISKVFYLNVSSSVIQQRLSHRLVCMNCHAVFSENDGSECSFCASLEFESRPDDNAESIKNRIEFHKKNMTSLLEHYKNSNHVVEIDASQNIKSIRQSIKKYIANLL